MSQQINLFNPIFLKQKKYFSALTMAQALGLILLGCIVMVAYVNVQLSVRTRSAAATAAQLLETQGQLITITSQFGPHQNNPALDDDIAKMQSEIALSQHVFDTLQSGDFGNTNGYSGYFRAFSRQIIDGLWLTGISIVGAGHDISLRGRTINPELVPEYLTRLKREPEMQGKSFSVLEMQVPKANAETSDAKPQNAKAPATYLEFNLRSSESTDAGVATEVKSKMKKNWQRIAAKIDGFGLRERILIFLMAAVILIALVNVTMLDAQLAKETELSQQIVQDQSQIAGIQAEIRDKVSAYSKDPDAAKKAQFEQLKQKSAQMHVALQDMQKGLVSPDRMSTLLDEILKQNGKLHLVSLRTLPVSGLNEPEPAESGDGANNKNASDKPANPAHPPADAKDRSNSAPQNELLYKHGVEIVIEGDYLDMVNYMTALEAMPWQLFWGKARLTADDSSKLSLTLTLYTLSLDKKWLNI